MRIERIVVNASPLICLYKSGLSDILPSLFSEIVVPDKVHQEITAKSGIDLSSIKQLKLGRDIVILPSIASWDLGEGESSVISFALKNPDYWAVIDDREARRCAISLGCRHMGTIGIILLAKRRGIIPSVRESLHKLHTAGLWLSESFIKEVCRIAKEE
jgi:predicted nucleic acid-binding protein